MSGVPPSSPGSSSAWYVFVLVLPPPANTPPQILILIFAEVLGLYGTSFVPHSFPILHCTLKHDCYRCHPHYHPHPSYHSLHPVRYAVHPFPSVALCSSFAVSSLYTYRFPALTLALTLVLSSLSQVPPPCTHPHTRTLSIYRRPVSWCARARPPTSLSLSHSPTFFGIVVTWGPLHCPLVVVSVHRRKHKVIRYNKVPGRRASCRRRRRRHR